MSKRIEELKNLHEQSAPEFKNVIININKAVKEGDSRTLKFMLSGLVPALKSYHSVIDELFAEIESQKAITELAVKGLEYVQSFPFLEPSDDTRTIKRHCHITLTDIARLSP